MSALPLHPASYFLIAFAFLSGARSTAQDCSFDLGPDTVLCNGGSILLGGPPGALSIQWQNGWEVQYLTADTAGTYWCTATLPVLGQNVVANSDFSSGDSDFTTDLALGMGGTWGLLSLEGTYGMTTDPTLLHSNFPTCGDHTTGDGNMLLVNGSATPDASIWCQTISVEPNMTYAFSAWLMSASPESPAILDFTVNGAALGAPLLASTTTCAWEEFFAIWESGTSTTANICITNQNLAGSGNDFALDDITFTPLCTYTDSITITILPPAPDLEITGAEAICPGSTVTLNAALDPSTWPLNDVVMTWSTGNVGSSIVVGAPGLYEATAQGRCLDAVGAAVIGADTCISTLTMPNVFTPNGDGRNDLFLPIVIGEPSSFSLEIRNRWGQVVFTSNVVGRGWDGRVAGSQVPNGTYFWTITYTDRLADGSTAARDAAGHVTLLGYR